MRFFFVAILFLCTVGLFAWVARFSHKQSVEDELGRKTTLALAEAGFGDVTVTYDHMVASLRGFVDSKEDRAEIIPVLEKAVPGAYFPEPEDLKVEIRPTLPPWVKMTKAPNSLTAKLEGSISINEEAQKRLLGARLHSVSGGNAIANEIQLDARRLPLIPVAEFASLAAGLIATTESSELILKDNQLTVRAEVENAGTKFGLMEIANSIENVTIVDELTVKEVKEFRKPSEMDLTKTRFGITLQGKVPDEKTRDQIKNALLAVPETIRVNGNLDVDPSVDSPLWLNNALTVLPLYVAHMENGAEAHYGGDRVLVKGFVKEATHHEAILAALGELAKEEESLDVVAEVSMVEAAKKEEVSPEISALFEEGVLTLGGILPSDDLIVSMILKISESHPDVKIDNRMKSVVLVKREPWLDQIGEFMVEVLRRTKQSNTEIRDGKVILSGEANNADETRFLHNLAVNTVPTTFTILNTLDFEPVKVVLPSLEPEAEKELMEQLEILPIYFDVGSDTVGDDQGERLKSAFDLIQKTGVAFPIVVGGLSDTQGDPEKNKELSVRRASSVRDAMIAMGIAEERITATSFGIDAINTARNVRWKARRVEIAVAKPEEAKEESGEN